MPFNIGLSGRYQSDSVSGLGAYNVRNNSLLHVGLDQSTSPPSVRNTNQGEATIINHREYLGDLYTAAGSPSAFTISNTYAINPGNPALFPWLSTMAQRFQEYEIRGMLVYLKTLSSDYSATLNMGSVFMAADYNASDPAPIDKTHLENMEYSSSCKPSTSLLMPIECSPRYDVNTHLYVAVGDSYQGGDVKLYNLGNIYIGSQGVPNNGGASTPIAEIWVTYEVALFKPIIPNVPIGNAIGAHFQLTDSIPANPLNVAAVGVGTDPGFSITNDRQINFPNVVGAVYKVDMAWTSTAGATGSYVANGITLSGCTTGTGPWNGYPNQPLIATSLGHNLGSFTQSIGTTFTMMWTMILTITAANAYLKLSIPGDGSAWSFSSSNFGDVWITQFPLQIRS